MDKAVENPPSLSPWRTAALAPPERLVFAVLPLLVVAVFITAALLKPDARGVGTHEQLGLMPCMSVKLFNIPCPFCGMTTSFALFANGDPIASFRNQPAGAILFISSGLGALLFWGFAITGRWFPMLGGPLFTKRALQIAGVTVAAAWVYKIVIHRL
jgi:hypothetical protein